MSVYTVVNQLELEEFLKDFNQGTLVAFEGISAGIENTNYFVDTTKGSFVLTIFEHHSFEELPYFLDLMSFMAEHNIPTAQPKATKSGSYLKELKDKPAALVERLVGTSIEFPSIKQCSIMAKNLAKFHMVGKNYKNIRDNDRDINWVQQTFNLIIPYLPEDEKQLIHSEINFQNTIDWQSLPKSVIHADLFCDNALFNGNKLSGIIDLYYACNSTMIYDLAVMVNDWCRLENGALCAYKVEATLNSYRSVRDFEYYEKHTWQAALRMAALRFLLSRLKDKHMPREGEITQIKDPNIFKVLLKSE